MIAIVPNSLRDAINAKLDLALADIPEAAIERETYYQKLLEFYDDNGYIPKFTIFKKG